MYIWLHVGAKVHIAYLTTRETDSGKANEFTCNRKEVLVWDRACQAHVKSPHNNLKYYFAHYLEKKHHHNIIHSTSFLSHFVQPLQKLLKVNL